MCHNLNAMTFMTPSARGAQSDAYDVFSDQRSTIDRVASASVSRT